MKGVDKFGRFHGYRSSSGIAGRGFALTPEGNFDLGGRRLTNIGRPSHENINDAPTMEQVLGVLEAVNKNSRTLTEVRDAFERMRVHFFDKLDTILGETLEKSKDIILIPLLSKISADNVAMTNVLIDVIKKHKDTILVPTISKIVNDKFANEKLEVSAIARDEVTRTFSARSKEFSDSLKESTKKIERLNKDVKKIREEASSELKALTDVTREFVYKITDPGYARNSTATEAEIRTKLRKKESSWRQAFPEIVSES